ncbi:MAG: chromosome condensation regulator [Clostridia bacterium]|nr:chromosome condensation regulator [Clostridia bacterium]
MFGNEFENMNEQNIYEKAVEIKPRKKKGKKIIIIVAIVLVLAILAAAAAFVFFRSADANDNYVTLSAGLECTLGVCPDGTVVAVGRNNMGQCDVEDWKDIVSVDAGNFGTIGMTSYAVGLKSDGTVVVAGLSDDETVGQITDDIEEFWEDEVGNWEDIVSVSADELILGVKSDGTVEMWYPWFMYNEDDDAVKEWNKIKKWKDIVEVDQGPNYGACVVGLKSNGTVEIAGPHTDDDFDVDGWKDIVDISVGCPAGYFASSHIVGLKKDGTVVATGENIDGRCDVSDWTDIIAVEAGSNYTVGLKKDGTVVCTMEVGTHNWENIVAISAGTNHLVGLKANGHVETAGNNDAGQCSADDWTYIKTPGFSLKNLFR